MRQRIRFFDIAKGIGIICVVLGHSAMEAVMTSPTALANALMTFCFSFHMPLFFLLAGYFMHPERKFQWRKEARQLVYTYILTALVVIVGATLVAVCLRYNVWATLRSWIEAAWYGSGDISDKTIWQVSGRIGAIWFLLAMFWARMFMHLFARLPWTPVWVAASFIAGYFLSRYVWLPWSLQSGMCAVAFVYLGYLARECNVLEIVRKYPWIWAVAAAIWAASMYWFTGFSMAMNQYGLRPSLAVAGSIAGTLCIVGISQWLDHVPYAGTALSKAGVASLAILCAHLVDEDVLPWMSMLRRLQPYVGDVSLVFISFGIHMVIGLAGAWLLYYIPKINTWFYPVLAKKTAIAKEEKK
ncbi:acyltransferase family protein [Bifidobacterium magnum]|uniref:O-acetyltransferase n=1 Tax=Bifidobacterium magnum TaxID=1692 RepID=A0A087B837_9BIFI|nr:acyltransferase family protein [Bifidobacterium magnum]KFI67187.1 O-acetyltransferase [Bifidobacterium magnum]